MIKKIFLNRTWEDMYTYYGAEGEIEGACERVDLKVCVWELCTDSRNYS
jgi:hypothetical protein